MDLWLIAFAALAALLTPLPSNEGSRPRAKVYEVPYSEFLVALDKGRVDEVKADAEELTFTVKDDDNRNYITTQVPVPDSLIKTMHSKNVRFAAESNVGGGEIIPFSEPIMYGLVGLGLAWLHKQWQGGGDNVASRADKTRLDTSLSFDDIAGIDDAKAEVIEVVNILKNPQRYAKLGARVPAGILLCGPPGTGKTLMARVIAAEAKLPFLSCSGSDFVEMFVGRGAARVRELFDRARRMAPSLVFIDELDALGKERGRGGASHDEAEQTLNQLLASMDGIEAKQGKGVVCVAATNRFDVLDEALVRPGRFDRVIRVNRPDAAGRERVLRVHARKLPLARDVDFAQLASCTENMSPAELAGIVNEAAIHAAHCERETVGAVDFAHAVRRHVTSRGPQRQTEHGRSSPPPVDGLPQLLEAMFRGAAQEEGGPGGRRG